MTQTIRFLAVAVFAVGATPLVPSALAQHESHASAEPRDGTMPDSLEMSVAFGLANSATALTRELHACNGGGPAFAEKFQDAQRERLIRRDWPETGVVFLTHYFGSDLRRGFAEPAMSCSPEETAAVEARAEELLEAVRSDD